MYMDGISKMIFYVLPMILLFISMVIKIKKSNNEEEKEKIKNQGLRITFAIYCIAILSLLFLGSEYRMGHSFNNISVFSKENFELNANIIPFNTISRYVKCFFNNKLNLSIIAVNLIGNLIAFMPVRIFCYINME